MRMRQFRSHNFYMVDLKHTSTVIRQGEQEAERQKTIGYAVPKSRSNSFARPDAAALLKIVEQFFGPSTYIV